MQLCIIAKATCANFYSMGMDANCQANQRVDCFKCSNITAARHVAEILFWPRSEEFDKTFSCLYFVKVTKE